MNVRNSFSVRFSSLQVCQGSYSTDTSPDDKYREWKQNMTDNREQPHIYYYEFRKEGHGAPPSGKVSLLDAIENCRDGYLLKLQIKNNQVTFFKAAWLSVETHSFPSLSFDKFGFILACGFPDDLIIHEKIASGQWNSVAP